MLLRFSSEYCRVFWANSGRRCSKLLLLVGFSSILRVLLSCWSWRRKWKGEMTLSMRQSVASYMLLFEFI